MYLDDTHSCIKRFQTPLTEYNYKNMHHFEERIFENSGTHTVDKQNIPQLISTLGKEAIPQCCHYPKTDFWNHLWAWYGFNLLKSLCKRITPEMLADLQIRKQAACSQWRHRRSLGAASPCLPATPQEGPWTLHDPALTLWFSINYKAARGTVGGIRFFLLGLAKLEGDPFPLDHGELKQGLRTRGSDYSLRTNGQFSIVETSKVKTEEQVHWSWEDRGCGPECWVQTPITLWQSFRINIFPQGEANQPFTVKTRIHVAL